MKKTMRIQFEEKVGPRGSVHVAFIKKPRIDVRDRRFIAEEAVRAVQEPGGWRIDFAGNVAGAWLPWEAIDNVEYPTLAAAKKAIRAYAEREPTSGAYRPRRSSRRSRRSRKSRRRSGKYAPQPITLPGSRPGLVDIVEVDSRGSVLRVLQHNVPYAKAQDIIRRGAVFR